MLRVKDVMTTDVLTIGPDDAADVAWERMRTAGIHHLVVKRGAAVVGLFSQRDAGGRAGESTRRGRRVDELMSTAPVCVPPDTPVRKAANLMRGRSIGSLVVCDRGAHLIGIVTTADLLEVLGRGLSRPVVTGERRTLTHRTARRPSSLPRSATVSKPPAQPAGRRPR